MKFEEVRAIAKSHGIQAVRHSRTELVKMIQREEGNFDCYSTAYDGICDQMGCCWREGCFEDARKAGRPS